MIWRIRFSNLASTRTLVTRRYSSATSAAPKFNVLFFGRDEFSCQVLQEILEARDVWQDIHVVTQPDTKTGRRGSKLSISPLKLLAEEARLPVHTIPHERSEFKTWKAPSLFIPTLDSPTPPPHHLLITASFGRILRTPLLNLFAPSRRVNVHPSLLPAYRGPAPIQHALLDGQAETGVCVIEMTERARGVDSGDIWACERMDVPAEGATFPALRDELARKGGRLLVGVMRNMLAGNDTRTPQATDPSAPRAPLITTAHATPDFRTMSAARIVGLHRALAHQKPVTAVLKTGKTLQLHEPTVLVRPDVDVDLAAQLDEPGTALLHAPSGTLVVRCAEGTFLRVPKVRQQDRSLLRAKEWWNGVKPEMRVRAGEHSPVQFVSAVPADV